MKPSQRARAMCSRCGSGSAERRRILRDVADGLCLHLNRVQQLQAYALDLLVEAVGEPKHARAGLRADVLDALRLMAAPAQRGG